MSKKSSTFAAENKIQMLMETEIKFDRRNYRKHSKKNKDLIRKSLVELGAGRSVVIDNENELVAGNGVYEQAQALKMPVRIVETDGSELVVVKRTDLATQDEKRKKLARLFIEPGKDKGPAMEALLKMAKWKERQINKRMLAQLRRMSVTQKILDQSFVSYS